MRLQLQVFCKKQKTYAGRLVYAKKDLCIYQLDGREDKVHQLQNTSSHFLAHMSMSLALLQALSRPQNTFSRRRRIRFLPPRRQG